MGSLRSTHPTAQVSFGRGKFSALQPDKSQQSFRQETSVWKEMSPAHLALQSPCDSKAKCSF
jgi:hypothetical protein